VTLLIWSLVGVLALAGAIVVALAVRRRSRADVLSHVVAEVMSGEWASRLGVDGDSLREAILCAEPSRVREQLLASLAEVSVNFDIAAPRDVGVSVRCEYADYESVTTTSAKISWDLVPAEVRDQYLRTGESLSHRQWLRPDSGPALL
jgi:cytochrome c-type biogenesis protein CcmH/NrfF